MYDCKIKIAVIYCIRAGMDRALLEGFSNGGANRLYHRKCVGVGALLSVYQLFFAVIAYCIKLDFTFGTLDKLGNGIIVNAIQYRIRVVYVVDVVSGMIHVWLFRIYRLPEHVLSFIC